MTAITAGFVFGIGATLGAFLGSWAIFKIMDFVDACRRRRSS